MKKILGVVIALVCLMSLISCGGKQTTAAYTKEQAQKLLDGSVFSEQLEDLDLDTAWSLYQLEGAGVSRDQLTDGVVHRSSGGTCEELALLIFQDEESAKNAKTAMESYLQSEIEENKNYRPAEIPKLEDAFLQQAGKLSKTFWVDYEQEQRRPHMRPPLFSCQEIF